MLDELGGAPEALLGRGGEASVYALDGERVLRIQRPGASETSVLARAALLDELGASAHRLSFSIPRVLEADFVAGRWVTVERRLPGRSPELELDAVEGTNREAMIRRCLSAASELGELAVTRSFFGELHEGDPIRAETWRAYLRAAGLPQPGARGRHLFRGERERTRCPLSAILDFGGGVMIGDAGFNALAAAAYLGREDRAFAEAWLSERGVATTRHFRRWLAAYWAFARDDEKLRAWCLSELSGGRAEPRDSDA